MDGISDTDDKLADKTDDPASICLSIEINVAKSILASITECGKSLSTFGISSTHLHRRSEDPIDCWSKQQ